MPTPAQLSVLCLIPSTLAMLWLVLRASWFWNHNPELQFGWVVLLLWACLLGEAWSHRPPPRFQWTGRGVALTLLGMGILFFAQLYRAAYGVTTEGMSALAFGALAFIAGNIEYVFGRDGLRQFVFAFAFLLLALPVPETIYYPLVSNLQSKVALLNVELLICLASRPNVWAMPSACPLAWWASTKHAAAYAVCNPRSWRPCSSAGST